MEPRGNEGRVWSVKFNSHEDRYTAQLEEYPSIYFYATEAEAALEVEQLNINEAILGGIDEINTR